MAISDDVMDLVRILNEADLAWLAGEILTEIERGRLEVGSPFPERQETEFPQSIGEAEATQGTLFEPKSMPEPEAGGFEDSWVPIPSEEHLAFALEFIELKLLEPVRRLAEAERIAGKLAALPEPPGDEEGEIKPPLTEATLRYREPNEAAESPLEEETPEEGGFEPIRIAFLSIVNGDRVIPVREASAGSVRGVEDVQAVLDRIRDMRS